MGTLTRCDVLRLIAMNVLTVRWSGVWVRICFVSCPGRTPIQTPSSAEPGMLLRKASRVALIISG